MKNKVLDNISFAIGAISIVLFFIFVNNIKLACIIGGIGSTLYGICSLLKKERMGYIFISIGVSVALGVGLHTLDILDQTKMITFILCLSLALLMVVSVVFNIINALDIKKRYSLVVEAKVIDLVKNPNVKGEYYQPIYQYDLDNISYCVEFPGYKKWFVPKIGDALKIFIEPGDHANTYFDKTLIEKISNYSISIFLAVVSLIIVVTLFI